MLRDRVKRAVAQANTRRCDACIVNFLWRHGDYDRVAVADVGPLVLSAYRYGMATVVLGPLADLHVGTR